MRSTAADGRRLFTVPLEETAIQPKRKKPGTDKPAVRNLDSKAVRRGLAAFLILAIVVLVAVALIDGDEEEGSPADGENAPVALSAGELVERAATLDHVVYWVGPRAGTESYELSSTPNGDVYIRYLTGDAEAGAEEADFLTVGTYPLANARGALRRAAAAAEGTSELSERNGFEVLASKGANNAYVVFDEEPGFQVEVYSPQKGEAEQLAASGALRPVG